MSENEMLETEATEAVTAKEPGAIGRFILKHGKGPFIGIICGIIVAVIAIIYFIGVAFYSGHLLPGTYVNGTSVANMTPAKAESMFTDEADGYTLTLVERDDQEEVIEGADIDLEMVFSGEFQELKKSQNAFSWPAALFSKNDNDFQQVVSYDEDALDDIIADLSCMKESSWTESENPTLSDYDSEDGYTLVDEVYGTVLDEDTLKEQIIACVSGVQPELNLSDAGCYEDPEYTVDSDEAQEMLETANTYAGTTITFTLGTDEVIDADMISEWMSVDDEMNITLDEDAITEYVADLASTYNTYGKSKQLATSYGSTVTVPGGNYGWKMDQETTVANIVSYIESGEDYSGEPAWTSYANSHTGNDYGNTYVEINLTAQHLFYYVNGSLLIETDFVSGNVSKGNGTPTGAYQITYTEKDATLTGANYSSDVSFWMPFCGNVGMHDATWRSTFGGAIYLYSGSHGCINLPYSAAKTIFENIEAGYPVLVYELAGTENAGVIAYNAAQNVISAIDAIGTVSLDSESAISAARVAYDALDDTGKGYVTNYDTLTAAESTLQSLKDQAAAATAAAEADAQAQTEANTVIDLINSIVDASSYNTALTAYNNLSDTAKAKVTNYSTLEGYASTYGTSN